MVNQSFTAHGAPNDNGNKSYVYKRHPSVLMIGFVRYFLCYDAHFKMIPIVFNVRLLFISLIPYYDGGELVKVVAVL